jgi:F-type H+-transporting ATPase subunit gamma
VSDTTAGLRHQIDSAAELQSVVRTMKAIAASNIGQYEQSVRALADYERAVELGLGACLRSLEPAAARGPTLAPELNVVVFGSDQGLVGRFNEAVAEHAVATLAGLPEAPRMWCVGDRVHALLGDAGLTPSRRFAVPTSVHAIAGLVGQILVDSQQHRRHDADSELQIFHNRPASGATYSSVDQRLLPLDARWQRARRARAWPTTVLPEVLGGGATTLAALIGEHLFVSLFRACAESLASENASRLAAMERADKNIAGLLEDLRANFHRLRQDGIDEELFDVISGFEALGGSPRRAAVPGQLGHRVRG